MAQRLFQLAPPGQGLFGQPLPQLGQQQRADMWGRAGAVIGQGFGQGIAQGAQRLFQQRREDELTLGQRQREDQQLQMQRTEDEQMQRRFGEGGYGGDGQQASLEMGSQPGSTRVRVAPADDSLERLVKQTRVLKDIYSMQPETPETEEQLYLTEAEWQKAGGTTPGSGISGEAVAARDVPEEIRALDPNATVFYRAAEASRRKLQTAGVGKTTGGSRSKGPSAQQAMEEADALMTIASGNARGLDTSLRNPATLERFVDKGSGYMTQQGAALQQQLTRIAKLLPSIPAGPFKDELSTKLAAYSQVAAEAQGTPMGTPATDESGGKSDLAAGTPMRTQILPWKAPAYSAPVEGVAGISGADPAVINAIMQNPDFTAEEKLEAIKRITQQ